MWNEDLDYISEWSEGFNEGVSVWTEDFNDGVCGMRILMTSEGVE